MEHSATAHLASVHGMVRGTVPAPSKACYIQFTASLCSSTSLMCQALTLTQIDWLHKQPPYLAAVYSIFRAAIPAPSESHGPVLQLPDFVDLHHA